MLTTPRWNDAGDPRENRDSDGALARSRSPWSGARSISHRQVDELKRRLRSGAYDTPQMLDALARRLIESGEL